MGLVTYIERTLWSWRWQVMPVQLHGVASEPFQLLRTLRVSFKASFISSNVSPAKNEDHIRWQNIVRKRRTGEGFLGCDHLVLEKEMKGSKGLLQQLMRGSKRASNPSLLCCVVKWFLEVLDFILVSCLLSFFYSGRKSEEKKWGKRKKVEKVIMGLHPKGDLFKISAERERKRENGNRESVRPQEIAVGKISKKTGWCSLLCLIAWNSVCLNGGLGAKGSCLPLSTVTKSEG